MMPGSFTGRRFRSMVINEMRRTIERRNRIMNKPRNSGTSVDRARPIDRQKANEIQAFGHLTRLPIALSQKVASQSVENLNQVLADTITLRDLYKNHHWQGGGAPLHPTHPVFG